MSRDYLLVLAFIVVLSGCTRTPEEPKSKGDSGRDVKVVEPSKEKPKPSSEPELKAVEALKSPEVKRGTPIHFLSREYDVKEYKEKSNPAASVWFKVDGDRWYIDWDADRRPFTTIVVHHSATGNDTTTDQIEDIQKDRLYAPRYRSESKSPFVKGLPVHSGHVINGKERFIGYHHLVYSDGKVTTELSSLVKIKDTWHIDHVGWHAGNWVVNCSSVAICLIGDFSEREPPEAQLRATAGLIVHYRTFNPKATVTSHGDHAKTECPGKTWPSWKKKLQALYGE